MTDLRERLLELGYVRGHPEGAAEPDFEAGTEMICPECGGRMRLFEGWVHEDAGGYRVILRCIGCRWATEF